MPAKSLLFLPPPELSGAIFAAIFRDTRGAALTENDRYNHFPASPLWSVTHVFDGALQLARSAEQDAREAPELPAFSVLAPQDLPTVSWSPGPVRALSVGIYPNAWARLALADGPPPELWQAFAAFNAKHDPANGWLAFCNALPSAWQGDAGPLARLSDWSRALIARAALSGPGRSLRSLERRIRRQSGLTRSALNHFAAIEDLHRTVASAPSRPLAEIALEAGFSDQSHMGRALRRTTGFSPARLNRLIDTEEPFWAYRLLGERF